MTRAAVGTIAPIVAVDGSDLREEVAGALIGMQVSSGLRLPSRVRLEFLDDGFALSAGGTFAIGHAVTVRVASGDKLFTGEITGVELDVEQGAPNLTVIADDLAYRMTLGNRVATYLNMTYSDVVSKLVSSAGLKKSITATSTTTAMAHWTTDDSTWIADSNFDASGRNMHTYTAKMHCTNSIAAAMGTQLPEVGRMPAAMPISSAAPSSAVVAPRCTSRPSSQTPS